MTRIDIALKQKDMSNDLTVDVTDFGISISVNANRIFHLLSNKDNIIAGLNKELSALIQKHLETKADEEKARIIEV